MLLFLLKRQLFSSIKLMLRLLISCAYILAAFSFAVGVWADTDADFYSRQSSDGAVNTTNDVASQAVNIQTTLPDDPVEEEKVPLWKRLLGIKKKPKPVKEDKIKSVGPRQYAAVKLPLLRLQKTVVLPSGKQLEPGFFLVKPVYQPKNESVFLGLFKESKEIARVLVEKSLNIPAEPVTYVNQNLPKPLKVQALHDEQNQQLFIRFSDGDKILQSIALPVIGDSRPLLYP